MISEREILLATEHPRGTERRKLGPFRDALQSPEAYARLPEPERDEIVRWAETRRLVKERSGLDHDRTNLADPLLPLEKLRQHVLEGERIARGASSFEDGTGSLFDLVARIRARGSDR